MNVETALDPAYHSHFRQHVHRTSLHVRGLEVGSDTLPLPPFCTDNPVSYWTADEKAAFFHGLSVHSRLRPDLIAEAVRTKSTLEVYSYINRLEEGMRSQEEGLPDRRARRRNMDGALEVSDAWIEWEEKQSHAIVVSEANWDMLASEANRKHETLAKKREIFPPIKAEGGLIDPDEREKRQTVLDLWLEQQNMLWGEEDLWGSMDMSHFKVIDNILRDEEDALAAKVIAKAANNSRQATLEPTQITSLPSVVDDSNIDPLLRDPTPIVQYSSTSGSTQEAKASLEIPLSPASRKRLRKRLYMRRKRAEAAGSLASIESTIEETVAAAVPIEGVRREKPGRKSRPKRPKIDEGSADVAETGDVENHKRKKRKTQEGSVDVSEAGDMHDIKEEADDDPDHRHPHIPGKTRHYKIKGQLQSMGLDAKSLHAKGLGLFHISALGKYTKMYVLLHPPSLPEVASKMSAEVIQFLHAHVVQYVTELMHRVIASREQERAMKGRTKVWRFDTSNIYPATIDHARDMMGDTRGTRESYFQELFTRLDIDDNESEDDQTAEAVDSTEETSEEEDQDGHCALHLRPLSPLSLPRAMYPPLIRLPDALDLPDTMHVPLESDIDEGAALEEVLREEDILEAADCVKGEQEERVLWGEYGPKGTSKRKLEQVEYAMSPALGDA